MITTHVFDKNLSAYNNHKRIIINQGGTSSSKTYSIIQVLIAIIIYSKKPLLISIVSESIPHLKRGVIRDFQNIMAETYNANSYNLTDRIYYFPNGSVFEFFSADDPTRLRGGRRDILFINECNNLSEDAFNELDVRTRKCTFLDFNPVSDFWAMGLVPRPDADYIQSTYLDALSVLAPEVVSAIESRRSDVNWWRVYGQGLTGKVEGLIHPSFDIVDAMPTEAQTWDRARTIYGLDFGFSNDPSVLIKCIVSGKDLYSDQIFFETGMTNAEIVRRMTRAGVRKNYDEIFADSAEPKSIYEIQQSGYNIKAVKKGPDSIINGISKVNEYKQYWTKSSVDAIKEMRNYRWIENSDGKFTNKPGSTFNHALDARRYAVMSLQSKKSEAKHLAIY